ncbi:MAG: 1-(5-phosphoribosyl)-5-[(5-phosphoribosylamino)methylideneamino]imidazole-4-carboxamide isomerase [Deltaproteobacteria bacterium]|nr:1-(5-phosphoribosyl)-5-[(5-phosphoribosylamino)methylideneamino]imidazole-4-carboxamide isomerase [Deltaproteobacteria bacterium]
MIIFPAVDIKGGRCVRLKQGRASEETVFSDDPLDMAGRWVREGASWLHVVDLDGAFQGRPVNLELIASICALPVSVQVGGGIRDPETARRYLEAGVDRLVLGTLALENPALYSDICAAFPGRIGASLDAQGGRLKTRGWIKDAGLKAADVLPRLAEQGSAFVVYTDIERDGTQSGLNRKGLEELCAVSPLPVLAAGGVNTLDDIRSLHPLSLQSSLQGVITGRAIYTGSLNLRLALDWLGSGRDPGIAPGPDR